MKHFYLFLIALFIPAIYSQAQISTDESLVRIETPKFTKFNDPTHYIYVPMDFNASDVMQRVREVDVNKIVSITLVYTQYKLSERFDQMALNQERMYRLYQMFPELKKVDAQIQWYWVAQTGCNSPEACNNYFHGFEIRLETPEEFEASIIENSYTKYYKELYTTGESHPELIHESLKTETATREYICDTTYTPYDLKNKLGYMRPVKDKSKKKLIRKLRKVDLGNDEISFVVQVNKRILDVENVAVKDGRFFEDQIRRNYKLITSRYQDKRVNTKYRMEVRRDKKGRIADFDVFTTPLDREGNELDIHNIKQEYLRKVRCGYKDSTLVEYALDLDFSDNVVYEVFERNDHWKNCLVATDVTGSMSPYIGQFLAWHSLNLHNNSKNHHFVFFNDGNNMRDMMKLAGKVGGVYYVETTDYMELEQRVYKAQRKGGGGDIPENNVEAILHGLKKDPSLSGVIMIADNWATPRDLKLLKKVNKPVHVIVCGARLGVNTAYLDLARKTGGTLHTIEQDLTELSSLNEGQSLIIQGAKYTIRNGEFVNEGKVEGSLE